jgi:hypothetical protein
MGNIEKQGPKPVDEKKPVRPQRVQQKIGEPADNLRKREQWFRKRAGK